MKQELLEKIYRKLHSESAVRNVADFCRDWLGVERSYMAVLVAKQRDPSINVMLTCTKRLDQFGAALEASNYPAVSERGRQLRQLASECVGKIWDGVK
jgi:hypothetical protein